MQKKKSAPSKTPIKKLLNNDLAAVVDALLEHPFFRLDTLNAFETYGRQGDDTDGGNSFIQVIISPDGDGHVQVISEIDTQNSYSLSHRFRTGFGGGMSPRTRTAIIILARAIQLDNLDHLQRMQKATE